MHKIFSWHLCKRSHAPQQALNQDTPPTQSNFLHPSLKKRRHPDRCLRFGMCPQSPSIISGATRSTWTWTPGSCLGGDWPCWLTAFNSEICEPIFAKLLTLPIWEYMALYWTLLYFHTLLCLAQDVGRVCAYQKRHNNRQRIISPAHWHTKLN